MVDLNEKRVCLKQKESCKNYELHLGKNMSQDAKLPNIADVFELWPYIMYYNETKNTHSKDG